MQAALDPLCAGHWRAAAWHADGARNVSRRQQRFRHRGFLSPPDLYSRCAARPTRWVHGCHAPDRPKRWAWGRFIFLTAHNEYIKLYTGASPRVRSRLSRRAAASCEKKTAARGAGRPSRYGSSRKFSVHDVKQACT